MFKLDLFEYYYLDKKPRFAKTKTLLSNKKKHLEENIKNAVKYNKNFLIPLGLQVEVAEKEIEDIKKDIFEKKVYNALVQLKRGFKKYNSNKKNANEINLLKDINVENLLRSRIIKIVGKIFNMKDQEKNSFIKEGWIIEGSTNKSNELNPSFFYNSLNKDQQNLISKLLNHKEFKKITDGVELSFKLILGPVKVDKKNDSELKKIEKESGIEEKLDEDSDDESDIESEEEEQEEEGDHNEDEEFDENAFAEFDDLVGDSEGEEEEVELDQEIDYNQVTDEEPSEDGDEEEEGEADDFFVEDIKEKKEKKEKHKLPELAVGYYSGDEEEDKKHINDKLVEEIVKPQRKNRRGQRERQKIWELKYGGGANHVKKAKEDRQKERERKQLEWEERERKRQEKLANSIKDGSIASGGNSTPLGVKGNKQQVHPSWEAKKKQQELSSLKFEGTKKKFD